MQPVTQIRRTQRSLQTIERKAQIAVRRYLRSARKLDDMEFPTRFNMRNIWDIVRDAMLMAFQVGFENRPIGHVNAPKPLQLADDGWSPYRRQTWKVEQMIEDEGLGGVVENYGAVALQELARLDDSLRPYINRLLDATTVRESRVALAKLMELADARTQTLITTATTAATSAAHYAWDQRPAVRDEIWGYEYVTMADDRVRPEHEAMHGVIQPKEWAGWKIWWPPNGWNCRCVLTTLYEPYEPIEPGTVNGRKPQPDAGFATGPR